MVVKWSFTVIFTWAWVRKCWCVNESASVGWKGTSTSDAEKQNLEAWVPCRLTPASHNSIHVYLKNSRASMHNAGLNFSSSSSQHICGPLVKNLWSTDLKTLTSIIWFIFTPHCLPLSLQIRTTILVLLEWPAQDVGLPKEKDITKARIFYFFFTLIVLWSHILWQDH